MDPVDVFWLALAVLVAVAPCTRVVGKFLDRVRRERRRKLVAALRSITGLNGGDGSHVLRGMLASGRPALIIFEGDGAHVDLKVDAPDAQGIAVTAETLVTRAEERFGARPKLPVGDDAFDRRFRIEANDSARALRAFRGPALRSAVERVFNLGARQVRFAQGCVVATGSPRALAPADYRTLLDALDAVARALERRPLTVRLLGGERHALVDEHGKTRCPYCHGGLTGDEPDLVACEKCATVLHAGCWEEHGGCPLLGCTGKHPERERVGG
jgi:hypothetical protein